METRIILSGDTNFLKAKEVLKWCYDHRVGELHEIKIRPYKKDRSTEANKYYWGVVVNAIADHAGYTPAETHYQLLGTVFGWKIVRSFDGHERSIPNRSTTSPEKMSVQEFSNYITQCQVIAANLGVGLEPFENYLMIMAPVG